MNSPLFEILKRFYNENLYNKNDLQVFVRTKQISQDEFEKIVGGE